MGLETVNYVNDLVVTNPTSADPKSQGDDHLRAIKTAIKQTINGFTGAVLVTTTDTGTATAHVLTPTTALPSYTPMLCLLYLPAVTNTGAVTVNVSGLGAKSIKTLYGSDPTAGDIVAGTPILLMYNGTNFINLAGSEFLSKTGNQTLTGNLTLTGNQTLTGNETIGGTLGVAGNATVGGTLSVTNNTTLNGNLNVIGSTSLSVVTVPTRPANDNTTNAANTAFVLSTVSAAVSTAVSVETARATTAESMLAPIASPALTGIPTAPTATAGTSSTQLATTAFVATTAFSSALPAQIGNAGKFITTDGANASWAFYSPDPLMTQGII